MRSIALVLAMAVLAAAALVLLNPGTLTRTVFLKAGTPPEPPITVNVTYVYLHMHRVPAGVPVTGGKTLVSYIVILGVANRGGEEARVERVVASIPYSVSLACGSYHAYFTLDNSEKYEGLLVSLAGANATICSYSIVDDLIHGFNHYTKPVTIPPHASIYLAVTGVVDAPAAWSRLHSLRGKPVYILAAVTASIGDRKAYAVALQAEKLNPIDGDTYYYSTIPGGVVARLDNNEVVDAWLIEGQPSH